MKIHARIRALALVLAAASLLPACDDPIIFVGDLPGIMRRVAGVPNDIGDELATLAVDTRLNMPRGLAIANDGTLYIADTENGRVVAVSADGRAAVLADPASCIGDACVVRPTAVAVASDGAVWIADAGAHRIYRIHPDIGAIEVRAGIGVAGDSPNGTSALEAMLNEPYGIAIGAGVVYFSEAAGHRVRYITSQGTLGTVAGTGTAGYTDGVPADEARLDTPLGIAVRGAFLYIADEQNDRVRQVNLVGGGIRTIAGNGVPAYSETDTIAVTAKLNRPRAVAVTPDGAQLYIADAFNDRVRVVNLQSGRIARFAGTGSATFNGEGLDAGDTSLDGPAGLAIHPEGTLFIADSNHQIVWRTPLRF